MGDTSRKKEPVATEASPRLPQYIFDHAPIFHLYSSDRYRPSSISAFLHHTRPQIEFKDVAIPSPPLTLASLDQLNDVGTKGGKDVYLTSNEDVTSNPEWLDGVHTDSNGGTGDNKTGVIITVNKGNGVMDAFYFCFFAFNWGGIVLDHNLGNHVGDWEHVMLRFINGVPKYAWLSQHANGEAYAFNALEKDSLGNRPILYIANGSHAIYPRAGAIDHTIPNFNSSIPFLLVDTCDKGPRYDPLLTSYTYTYTHHPPSPSSLNPPPPTATAVKGTFTPLPSSPDQPTSSSPELGWLYFTGRWGDAQYPADDARQKGKDLFGFRKYGGGPTGPAAKDLERKEVWPGNEFAPGQRVRRSLGGGLGLRDWLVRWGWKTKCSGKRKKAGEKGVKRVDVDGRVVG